MKTIRKNQKIAKELFKKNLRCTSMTLCNNFEGSEVDKEWAEKKLHEFSSNKLIEDEEGVYTIQIHSNFWIEITVLD